jgi:hypothetical protein
MNKLADNIKLIISRYHDSVCYTLGIMERSYIVQCKENKNYIGYWLADENISYTNDYVTIKLDILNPNHKLSEHEHGVFLTKDNLLIMPFHRIVINLKTKVLYKYSHEELSNLKDNLSDRTSITLRNK